MYTFQLDIVSAEKSIFSGTVDSLVATGELGELGITPGHAPLLTKLKPGTVKVTDHDGKVEHYYVSGGMLEVQPHVTTILADTAARADDVDEAAAIAAKEAAEAAMTDQNSEIEYSKAAAELAEAVAQLRTIQAIRKKVGK
ncbi:F0F1 ATP synthase subunit epsilon [Aliikangiella coralliicola]|uniref:ATP synthase epsilon chain n=1 Tax=Aliikangiella coralliicola TaxID=2592383 RepID=A0A545UGK3_9GAMM|nr:F0F1 ATP synthase subunit epsilon [Aliikangiella coralliicola]TQV88612.1 F0F1 ATP synthase subunit epsilon [Aliikangiella coralliicola]